MYTGLFDVFNTILQYIMIFATINYCIGEKYKINKIKVAMWAIISALVTILITSIMGNYSLSIILMHIVGLALVIIPYNKDKLTATIAFSIVYVIILILAVSGITMWTFFTDAVSVPREYEFIVMITFMYLPSFIVSYLYLTNMTAVHKVYLMFKSRVSGTITLIMGTLVLDFLMAFSLITNDKDNPVFKEIIFIFLGILIVAATWYFANIDKKAREIHRLNIELENKINELKKIKHDYGSQISYLYGAYLMKNYEKLGELFKSVIEGNNISTQVKVLSREDSLLAQIVNSIDLMDVDVLIDERAELEHIKVNELDMHRIISNIVKNSIEALKGKGLLMIKSFYDYNSIVISIQNNGPEINKNIIGKIFEQGFSTKENKNKENGFGLYIVKELVNKYKGDINVKSTKELTEFTIKFPLHIN
ncbi:sensor histidine kinase [Caproiciproducens sp. MSJ-32]|uniref:sensor histidine kinase n=1 Tax=Caproiciproducens sp. MSJ-32 TaxID=2841527 RepID=UPI001C11C074|nr:ATP-binding protein [Caproiciproducens sp. MSJ-32]MBU5454180.1 ATP-binding protein [Caproiciproducens sp. MSJ-32]